MKQQTLKTEITLEGVGLHTGQKVALRVLPAKANHGLKFRRIDLEDAPAVLADVQNVISTNRSTTIGKGNVQISTVEHLLAALSANGISNASIELNGPEVPILDGSSAPFYQAILSAGVESQEEDLEPLVIEDPEYYVDEETGSEITLLPSDEFELTAMIDFDSEVVGLQYANYNSKVDFGKDIASARTFVFLHDLCLLLKHDLVKGGSLDNAVVFVEQLPEKSELQQIAQAFGEAEIKVEPGSILNKGGLHFENEPARHKLLDLIGDLSLVGAPIQGKVIIKKPGHTANVNLGKILKAKLRKQRKLRGIPKYDPSKDPIYNVTEIASKLPHRYPFLLVDKIIELSDKHVVGVKNVTFNEHFFQGHFPNNPVMPGVLQIEALAQTGGILALSTVPDPENWDTYFLKMNDVKFKKKVVPGDTLIFKMELLKPIRRGIVNMFGRAYVGDAIVSEGELTAQIVRRQVD